MTKLFRMPGVIVAATLALTAVPALADKLTFDHRLHPALKAVFDGGEQDMILFNDKNPAYVTDLIVVRGKSVRTWTEAMIIIARKPDAKARTVSEWLAELKRQAEAQCPSAFTIIAEDATSVTFERRSHGCPTNFPEAAIYRIVQGKPSLFLLGAMSKDGFTAESRQNWLALLASAALD